MDTKSSVRWRYMVIAILFVFGFYICFTNLNSQYNFSMRTLLSHKIYTTANEVETLKPVETEIQEPEPSDISIQTNNSDIKLIQEIEENAIQAEFSTIPTTISPKPVSDALALSTDLSTEKLVMNSTDTKSNIQLVTEPGGKSTFSKLLEEFDWLKYATAVKTKNTTQLKSSLEKIILELSYFLALPPIVPINPECKLPPLDLPEAVNCSNYPTGFTGVRNNHTVKIGMLIQFGFDVDVLEIYLNEVYDVVDRFFIIESTTAHQRSLIKPLMWEEVQFQDRFIKFAPKITHFVIDDAQSADVGAKMESGSAKTMWLMENLQETLRWKKFLEWNNARKFFTDDDVLGFGDADEIPSRKNVNMLKYCQMKGGMVDIGIWFPFGNVKQAFATDWPVKGHKYTLGDPGFWTLRAGLDADKGKHPKIPSRTHGTAANYLLGGMHMTHYGYLPFQLVKHITATEGGPFAINETTKISKKITIDDVKALELELAATPKQHRGRTVNLTSISNIMKDIAILPWFYDCNRDRYPIWEGRHDSRLYLPIQ